MGEGLSAVDVVRFTASYASFIKESYNGDSNTIVVGRDARIPERWSRILL